MMNRKTLIGFVVIFSWIYWIYLGFSSEMVIIFDSKGYEDLGKMIAQDGWISYFQTGPQREPLYPFLISLAMRLADTFSLSYYKIVTIFQIFILGTTQILILKILNKQSVNKWIVSFIILYWGISPGLVNSALSLYSEIATYPFIMGIIIVAMVSWESLRSETTSKNIYMNAVILGILFVCLTFTKGIFELIFPIFLIPFFYCLIQSICQKHKPRVISCLSFLLVALTFFYLPIVGYKSLNQKHNGQFVLTNRGAWALYGNTDRRMAPLSKKQFLTALAFIPGEGVCKSFFTEKECSFWSYQESDARAFKKLDELKNQGLSKTEINTELLRLSKKKVLENPLQYALFMGFESLKMFFWESTQIGFVDYPAWLNKIFVFGPFKNGLRLSVFLITFFSFLYGLIRLWKDKNPLLLFIIVLAAAYIGIHSFFFTLTRYSLPIAPLYLLIIAFCAEGIWRRPVRKSHNQNNQG